MSTEVELNKLHSRVGILEERQTNTKENFIDFKDDIKDGFTKLDTRFEKLEKLMFSNQTETRNKFDELKKDIIQLKIEKESSFENFYKKHPKLFWVLIVVISSTVFSGTLSGTVDTINKLF